MMSPKLILMLPILKYIHTHTHYKIIVYKYLIIKLEESKIVEFKLLNQP